MKITSKILYREIRAAVGPMMLDAGFKNLQGSSLGWVRPAASGHSALWFQCDKWGWDALWGSRFTVEFQMAPQPEDMLSGRGRRERIGHLLEGFEELDELRMRNNSIIENLPGAIDGRWVTNRLPDGTEVLVEGYKVDPEKAVYGRDIWLHYYSLDDVRMWGDYFKRKLPRFIALFENEIRSSQGAANLRFHKMMGRVQNAKELPEKAAILEQYIKEESDPHYRSGAGYWLNELAKLRAK